MLLTNVSIADHRWLLEGAPQNAEPKIRISTGRFVCVGKRQLTADEKLIQAGMRNYRAYERQRRNVRVHIADRAPFCRSGQICADRIEYSAEMFAIELNGSGQLQS